MATPSEAEKLVEDAITSHPVVVFSKTYCPFCRLAKSSLETAGAKVAKYPGAHVFELDRMGEQGAAVQAYLASKTGRRTVPSVFIDGKPVGGGDEVAAALSSGVLPQMLAAAVGGTQSAAAPAAAAELSGNEEAILFGAGCFWGVELAFQREPGVVRTEVGYANGQSVPVTYREVCSGKTGHAEVVKVWFRPQEVSLKRLLALWEDRHDVTSKNRQGNDVGTQYRSALFYTSEKQRQAVEEWKLEAKGRYAGREVATDIGPVVTYAGAEDYHQRYLEKGGQVASKGAQEKIYCYGKPSNV